MSKSVRIVLGFLISSFCLWYLFRKFDFANLRQSLQEASYRWFIPAAIVFVLNMTLRSFRWKILLTPLKEVSIATVMPKLLIGFFMNNILPARGGEFIRAAALSKSIDIPFSSVLGSIVAERLSDMFGLLMIIFFASQLLPWDKLSVLPIAISMGVGVILITALLFYSQRMKNENILKRLTMGFSALKSPITITLVLMLSFAIWIGELLIVKSVSYALHFNLSFFESAALLTGLSVGVMIPAAPGYVGTYEFFGKSVLTLIGKPEDRSLGYVLVLHFFQLILVALAAFPCLVIPERKKYEN